MRKIIDAETCHTLTPSGAISEKILDVTALLELSSQRFSRLTVLGRDTNRLHDTFWSCLCDCGRVRSVRSDHLLQGRVKSCGCLQAEVRRARLDLTGNRYGRLVVLEPIPDHALRRNIDGFLCHAWLCQCKCGNRVTIETNKLRSGNTKSCGCYRREFTTSKNTIHGHSRRGAYTSWLGAKARCTKTTNRAWRHYGGRGITMCAAWVNDFRAFLHDMGERPLGHSLDRINNAKGYEPGNCRWATSRQQSQNRSVTCYLEHDGHRRSMSEWSRLTGLHPSSIRGRLAAGWTIAETLTVKPHEKR